MGLISLGFFTFYRQAYAAVTDFTFYRTIVDQPLRQTLGYLLYLAAHAAILLTLFFAWHYGPRLGHFSDWAEQNFPLFRIEGGELQVEGQQPIVRRYETGQTFTFVFDTTASYDIDSAPEPAFIFGKENLYVRLQEKTQTYQWKDFQNFQKSEMKNVEQFIRWAYFPLGYSLWLIYMLASKSLLAVFLTIFGISASGRHGIRLPFRSYFTIALYALTPAVIIHLAVTLTGQEVPFFTFIYLATGAIYSYLATQKCVVVE